MKHLLPKTALDHHMAALGKTGSGKTSIIKAEVIEPALDAGERVATIDPTGAHWGLRLKADGKKKGYPVYIFGGRHADKPLLGSHGEIMAEFIGKTSTPCILDTSLMKNTERMKFFTDFADAILRTNEAPLRLVIDEAHIFMPQAGVRGSGAMPDMLHAGNNLISLGRSRGIRCVLISQRAAKLHKDSLTQVETLIAGRLIAPQDRKAVREWIADQADLEKGNEIIASLPKLGNGEAWVWAPEADFLKRIQFPKPTTYDSSSGISGKVSKKKLPKLDLEKLDERLAKVDAETKAHDPKELNKRIAELQRELSKKPAAPAKAPRTVEVVDKKAVEVAERRGFEQATKGLKPLRAALEAAMKFIIQISAKDFFKAGGKDLDTKAVEKAIKDATEHVKKLVEGHLNGRNAQVETLRKDAQRIASRLKAVLEQGEKDVAIKVEVRHNEPFTISSKEAPRPARATITPPTNGDGSLTRTMQSILDAIAWCESIGNHTPARAAVAFFAGSSPKSSTFEKYVSNLKSLGLLDPNPPSGCLALTEEGRARAAAPEQLLDHQSAMAAVRQKLTPKQFCIVEEAVKAYPDAIERDTLAANAGMSANSSTYEKYLSQLKSFGLLSAPASRMIAATPILFP